MFRETSVLPTLKVARRTKIMINPEKENSQISYEKYFSTSIKIWTPATVNEIFKFKIQEYESS